MDVRSGERQDYHSGNQSDRCPISRPRRSLHGDFSPSDRGGRRDSSDKILPTMIRIGQS